MEQKKIEFIIHLIQHDDRFPSVDEIDLDTAKKYLAMIDPSASAPEFTPEEFQNMWNVFVHDPKVMDIDDQPLRYKIKPEYYDLWVGSDEMRDPSTIVITEDDIERLAVDWDESPEELKQQLIPLD